LVTLYELKINHFNEDQEDILQKLWISILQKDPWWHFFYEGSYTIIRVSTKYLSKTKKFLKDNKIEFKEIGDWIDNIRITKAFQGPFTYIFHGYSELAMRNLSMGNDRVSELLDRVVHCFMNNMSNDKRRNEGKLWNWWEPMMVAKSAVGRAYTIGMIVEKYNVSEKGKQGEEGKAPQEDGS
jgi:hypothetical protein